VGPCLIDIVLADRLKYTIYPPSLAPMTKANSSGDEAEYFIPSGLTEGSCSTMTVWQTASIVKNSLKAIPY